MYRDGRHFPTLATGCKSSSPSSAGEVEVENGVVVVVVAADGVVVVAGAVPQPHLRPQHHYFAATAETASLP